MKKMNNEDSQTEDAPREEGPSKRTRNVRRHRLYTKLADLAVRRPWTMLGVALVATLIAAAFASRLELKMQFKNMMPQSHPTVKEYDRIVNQYSSASSLIVVVRGKEDEIKSFADELAPRLRAMKDFVRRVDYKVDTAFVRRHGFMLVKAKDLKNMQNQFADLGLLPFLTHLNDSFEKTYVADNESISNSEKEDKAVRELDGIETWLGTMQRYVDGSGNAEAARGAVDQFLVGDPYYIAPEKDMLLMFAQPTFTLNDVETMVTAVDSVDALIAHLNKVHPDVDAGITGTMALGRDEMVAVTSDMYITSIVAFLLIIALFIVSFRMWAAPILAGLSLAVGIIWAAGFSALTVGSLNLMTSMFAVILIGLGIDYNIHVISAYSENRSEGESIADSLRLALTKSGNGILVGAVSTALAFLTMLISKNLGMKEFGLVAGVGVLFCMLASLLVLPSLLVARDRLLSRRKTPAVTRSIAYHSLGRLAERLASRRIPVLLALVVVTGFLLYNALHITFDYNYLNMEPKGLRSIQLQDAVIDEFDVTPDMLLVTTNSVEKARDVSKAARELKSVGMVTSISDFVPSADERSKRLPYIRAIRSDLTQDQTPSSLSVSDADALVDQLYRLEDNIIELGQLAYVGGQEKVDRKTRDLVGDLTLPAVERKSVVTRLVDSLNADRSAGITRLGEFESAYEPDMHREALEMTSEAAVDVPDLPASIRNQFVSNDGSSYLVSIYPRQQVWDFEFLGRLTDQMHRIDPRITGLPPIFYILIQYIARDGRTAAILALAVIFILLLIDFRRLSLAVMAMTTLAVGAVWMVGLMHLLGMQFNIVNTIAIPLILGIGIDDSVHILNRYLEEGPGRLRVAYASTGKAVILTSLTTMIAFGSLGFAVYRGLASLGLTLFIGVGTALLTTALLLPALVGFLDEKWLRTGDVDDAGRDETKRRSALVGTVGCALIIGLGAGTVGAQNASPDVTEIVRKIDANERTPSSYSAGRQIITTSSGSKRTLDVEFYSVGQNEKTLTVYTGPARVKGDKILMLHDGDDIWYYTPKTDRVRHLASHARRQRVQGSEFSYEDMISGNLEDDYTSRLLGKEELDGAECYKLESVPTESGPSYSKIIVWAEVDRFVTRRIDYYEDGSLLKRLTPTDIREVEGHYLPFRLDMENLRDGGETVFEFDKMEVGVKLDDRLFTTTNLKRR